MDVLVGTSIVVCGGVRRCVEIKGNVHMEFPGDAFCYLDPMSTAVPPGSRCWFIQWS